MNVRAAMRTSDHGGAARYGRGAVLGVGGMGTVYAAYDRVGQREVACKWMSDCEPDQRPARIALFRREYDTLAQLPHPNIVEVYDYGEDGGLPYYVMELLGGADLAKLSPLPLQEACRVLRDIASAIALLHARRLVHRDVSPNNVRLTSQGAAKLLDFGALTPFGPTDDIVGTPPFMAPECLAGGALDQRSDLFSLGAMAYWTLTRRTPFSGRSFEDLDKSFAHAPLPPSSHAPGIPRALDELVLSLLALEPRARPASAAYVIDRLTSIAELPPETDERRVAESYLAHPPLCGRATATAQLQAAVDQARQGRGANVLVEGEAGLGRSAILESVALYGQLQGHLLVRAQGSENSSPFQLLRMIMQSLAASYPAIVEMPSALAFANPRVTSREPGGDRIAIAAQHSALIETALRAVIHISRHSRIVVVVDDIHLSDGESIALFAALALEAQQHPITLVMSRLSGAFPPSEAAWTQLTSSCARMTLMPLGKEDVGALVQAVFGGVPNSLQLALWLSEQSGGNPAIALDFVRLLLHRRLIRYAWGTFTLPQNVDGVLSREELETAVLARLGDLGQRGELIARILSIHKGPLTAAQIAAASELSLRDALLALEGLTQRGVVEKSEERYYLAGSSLRTAVQRAAPDEIRRSLHLKLASTLLREVNEDPSLRYDASLHFIEGGAENEGVSLIAGRVHRELYADEAARRAPLLEAALAVVKTQKRSKEQNLSLLLPLTLTGFVGSLQIHNRYVDTTVAWMADVCGLTLARRLSQYVGGKLALIVGLSYALVRRLCTPRRDRLGPLPYMIGYFVAMVCDAIASAAVHNDAPACRRFLRWLEPMSTLPKMSAGWVMREFCLATSLAASGRTDLASVRYAALIPLLARPIKGLENGQKLLHIGAINGRANCEAAMGSRVALDLADQLDTEALFASHAEVVRSAYYALRGDRENADKHRERAELLALRGGTSWSAATTLTVQLAYAATISEDPIALVRAIAELEALATVAPNLRAYKQVCEAWLEHVRGRSENALQLFSPVIATEHAQGIATVVVNWALYAAVHNALGKHVDAIAICERVICDPTRLDERSLGMRFLQRERAVGLAGVGRFGEAAALAEQQIAEAEPLDNPLELGASHRDRARIALLARDRAAFDDRFSAMAQYYQMTQNVCLLRQTDALLAKAEQAGLRMTTVPPRTRTDGLDGSDDLDGETQVGMPRKAGSAS